MQSKRLLIVLSIYMTIFSLILGKTFYEQVYKGPVYASQSFNNRSEAIPLEEYYRGDILDRKGEHITDTEYYPTLIIFPDLIEDVDTTLEKLNQTERVRIDRQDIAPYQVNGNTYYPKPIAYELHSTLDQRDIAQWNEPGIVIAPFKHRYGPNSLATHIVGYLGPDHVGAKGIELRYNDQLQGSTWEQGITPITDQQKNPLEGLGYRVVKSQKDTTRNNVILTLDREVQQILEDTLNEHHITKGAAVILDIQTGQILAAASRPEIDQNHLDETYGYSDNHLERVMGTDYKTYPGSIFKVITAAAALEEGLIDDEQGFLCNNQPPWDSCPREHGQLVFNTAMAVSCNNYFVALGEELGQSTLTQYMISKFGILLEPGKALDSPSSRANGVLGQELFQVSPLEMANMMATIARKGLHQPLIEPWNTRLVLALQNPKGEITKVAQTPEYKTIYSRATGEQLQESLIYTNQQGSGKSAWVESGGSAGKTGTPEIILPNGSITYCAWYTGYTPLEQPRYAMAVLVEEKSNLSSDDLQGGTHAGPIFKDTLEAVLALPPKEPSPAPAN